MKLKPKVYLETTITSYLTAWRSAELIIAANQQSTREWWDKTRPHYELFITEIVLKEATVGDQAAAARRLTVLSEIPLLALTQEAEQLAVQLLQRAALPAKARVDALHIAVATVHGMDYLLTWNCRHIANATTQSIIESTCKMAGYQPPVICTPPQLMGEFT